MAVFWRYNGGLVPIIHSKIVLSIIVNNRTHSFKIRWQTSFLKIIPSVLFLIKTATKKSIMNGVEHTPYLHSLAVFFRNWLSLVEHQIFNLKVVGSSPTFLIGSCQLDYSHDLWCFLLNSPSGLFFVLVK